MSKDKLFTYGREGHIATIMLNRPEKRNALNPAVWKAVGEAVAEAEKDREARVVLLRGAGQSFCAGLDLSPTNELFAMVAAQVSAVQKARFYEEVLATQAVHTRLERLAKPTLAVIQKHCLGAGLELALCCDILLSTEDAVFALPEAKLAFITDVGGLQRLPKFVNKGVAREIAFRGHRFDAKWAHHVGLVTHVLPDEAALLAKAMEIADDIAGNPPLAVQGAKEVMLYDEEVSLADSLQYNAARSAMIVPSEDQKEAVAAYIEKRRGVFKGE